VSEVVNIGICTFRRAAIVDTLQSLASQRLPANVAMHIIVADNDETNRQEAVIRACANRLGLTLTYLHAPACNISIARNACLDAATEQWFAFIDDDEIAEPDWLARLLAAREERDVVYGVSNATYAEDAPRWIVRADLHSARLTGNPWNGYTGNVLLRRSFINANALRFARDLGQIGGEDTMFFLEAHLAGARFGYAPDAIVHEPVPPGRARFRWLALRRFRSGQIHHMVLVRQGRGRSGTVLAVLKAFWCVFGAPVHLLRQGGARPQILRGAMHFGVVAAGLGKAPYREYAPPATDGSNPTVALPSSKRTG